MSDSFGWHDPANVTVESQPAIAVYETARGNICIRQEAAYPDEDVCILVRPENARRLVEAILALAGPEQEPAPLALAAPPDRTAAERQRRYRNAKRNGSTVTPDHDSDRDNRDGDRDSATDLFVGAPAVRGEVGR
jgi:hypothetical protein